MMQIRTIGPDDRAAIERFIDRVPEGDRTFFKEDVDKPEVVDRWIHPEVPHAVAVDGGEVVGYMAVEPLYGWSSHVGELRVIVDPNHRGRGVGRALARRAVLNALELGLSKIVVEVIADQESAVAMFGALGFDPEALLRDHVRDQSGGLRDLLVLAHSVEESYAAMLAAGVADAL